MSDVLRVHEWSYISLLQKASASCTDTRFAALDSDTIISKGSFSAALAAAGAVITAVDSVMEEQVGDHFCCSVAVILDIYLKRIIGVLRWTCAQYTRFVCGRRETRLTCDNSLLCMQARNAFCAVRPPGHHAGPTGIAEFEQQPHGSHGFCLLNNLAIGAAYAMNQYRKQGVQSASRTLLQPLHVIATQCSTSPLVISTCACT